MSQVTDERLSEWRLSQMLEYPLSNVSGVDIKLMAREILRLRTAPSPDAMREALDNIRREACSSSWEEIRVIADRALSNSVRPSPNDALNLLVTALEWLRETEPYSSQDLDDWSARVAALSAIPREQQAVCDTCKGFKVVNVDDWHQEPCPQCFARAALTQPAPSAAVWTAEQISHVEAEASELLAKGRQLPAAVESDGELTSGAIETLESLDEAAVFFRKEAAYECENMGSGGSAIALGRWKRFYHAIENVAHDIRHPDRAPVSPDTARDAARYRWLREHGYSFFNAVYFRGTLETFDAAIDSQLARENI